MTETVLEKYYRETLEWVGNYAAKRNSSLYCECIEKVIITALEEGQKVAEKKKYTKPRYDKVFVSGRKWLDKL